MNRQSMEAETTTPHRKFDDFNVPGWPAFPLGTNAHLVKHATDDRHGKPFKQALFIANRAISRKGFYEYN